MSEDIYDSIVVESDEDFRVDGHLSKKDCPICRSGAYGMKWTRDFHTKDGIHARDIAAEFGMSEKEVIYHIYNHELTVSVVEDDNGNIRKRVESSDFYINGMAEIYTALHDWFVFIDERKDDGYDPIKLDQLIKLSSEILKILSKMAELQGRLKGPGDAQSKVLKIEGNLNIITDLLSGGILCDKCTPKVMKKLEMLDLDD